MPGPVVAVALSGGIDSLAAGFLVRQQFKEVFGIHFTTGYEKNALDISLLETILGFKVHPVDLSRAFEAKVVDYFVRSYMSGKTPNPCLACNAHIKFGALFDCATGLGATVLATGHYARVMNGITPEVPDREEPGFEVSDRDMPGPQVFGTQNPWLERGADMKKDQSYFLSMVDPQILGKAIFPLGGMTKDEVRSFARAHKLTAVVPSESQDICFLPDKRHQSFIVDRTGSLPQPGPVLDSQGHRVGTHQGLYGFTVGQRKGINIPGPEPYYVKKIDLQTNTLHVCFKHEQAVKDMVVGQLVWNYPEYDKSVTVQIRYRHKAADATIKRQGNLLNVTFNTSQKAVTPGQAAVFYNQNRVIGAGIIQ